MEGNLFILFIAIVLSIGTVIAVIIGLLPKGKGPALSATPARPVSQGEGVFVRENEVEGYLLVDGKKIPTFNIGILAVGSSVEMRFYNNFKTTVTITDICLNGVSIFAYAASSASNEEKLAYAVQVLKQSANSQSISVDLPHQIEQIILDVENLNTLLYSGAVSQVSNSTEDYVWLGR